MARQRDSKLVGTVGNLIFYNRMGEYCIRTKPVSVRRTKASVNSGFNFGKASKIASQLRNLAAAIIPYKSDTRVLYRLTGAMNSFISWKEKKDKAFVKMPEKLPFIYGFQFNDQADLTDIVAIKVSVKLKETGAAELSMAQFIPGQSLHAPANAKSIFLKMVMVGINLSNSETTALGKEEIDIPNSSEPFQPPVISVPASAKTGDLLIIVMSVQYLVTRNDHVEVLNNKKKLPCGIVCAKCI